MELVQSKEQWQRESKLLGDIAAVVETSDYTYPETIRVLERLTSHYKNECVHYLAQTPILEVAMHRQKQFENSYSSK